MAPHQIFTTAGAFVSAFGSQGTGPGKFGGNSPSPYGVAVSPDQQQVYVADYALGTISRWGLAGDFISSFATAGTSAGQLSGPYDLAIQPGTDNVFVVEAGTNRVTVSRDQGILLSDCQTPCDMR